MMEPGTEMRRNPPRRLLSPSLTDWQLLPSSKTSCASHRRTPGRNCPSFFWTQGEGVGNVPRRICYL